MTSPRHSESAGTVQPSPIREYLEVAARRRWVILISVVALTGIFLGLSLQQVQRYAASSSVLLSQKDLAADLAGTPNAVVQTVDPTRFAQTQADLAKSPEVARRTLQALGLNGRPPSALLNNSTVTPDPNADLLSFSVTDRVPQRAIDLATEYAKQYTADRQEIDAAPIMRAKRGIATRLSLLGLGKPTLRNSLLTVQQQLGILQALQASNAFVVRKADAAQQVQPKTSRNLIAGIVLGLVFGIALAFLWEALDTRIRSSDVIEEGLGLPLLARLPEPPRQRKGKGRHHVVMLDGPRSLAAEAFGVLRTHLAFVNLEHEAKVIMVTSAVHSEGKSTTLANLAVAEARAGRDVIIVDFDLRRPSLHSFFGVPTRPGITDVALGEMSLEQALVSVDFESDASDRTSQSVGGGRLRILPGGFYAPNPGEFISGSRVGRLILELRAHANLVLVDTPPALGVGDAISLSSRTDAIVVLARLGTVRRPMIRELRRVLDSSPTPKLGFVLTGGRMDSGYGYTYGYGYEDPPDGEGVPDPTATKAGSSRRGFGSMARFGKASRGFESMAISSTSRRGFGLMPKLGSSWRRFGLMPRFGNRARGFGLMARFGSAHRPSVSAAEAPDASSARRWRPDEHATAELAGTATQAAPATQPGELHSRWLPAAAAKAHPPEPAGVSEPRRRLPSVEIPAGSHRPAVSWAPHKRRAALGGRMTIRWPADRAPAPPPSPVERDPSTSLDSPAQEPP